MVRADSGRTPLIRPYSGSYRQERCRFRLRGFHPLWPTFPGGSTIYTFCNSLGAPQTPTVCPSTPDGQRLRPLTPTWFRLLPFRSSLLRESLSVSSRPGTEIFHFPGFPSPNIRDIPLYGIGSPIRTSPAPNGCRGLTGAFRTLLRPSSASLPKASILGS